MYFCGMFQRRQIILAVPVLALLAVSCSKYEKLLKSPDLSLKYQKAIEYYNKEDYTKAITLFEQIKPYYKGSLKADTVDYYYAWSYFKQQDYVMAGHYFEEFGQLHPRSLFTEETDYMVAYCYYLMSPRPSLDQKNTYDAITAFQVFMNKYPKSKRISDCQKYIQELREKLVSKSYLNAKLYYNLGYYKAAIIALRNSLNEFPDTKYREELMYLLLKSNYLLAKNSVESKKKERFQNTVDEYYSFIAEFLKSKYMKEVQKMYDESAQALNL